ncbi:mobile mystery protein B [Sulfurospirillum sp. 1612]|uniref:mobile mystery protein B n=1 Tax=Sulfurospirillum sp. 1612 TaxID=3094835 RepID=UPI002F9431D6
MITFDKEGETPLDDISGLKLKKITSRKELDEAEAQNILKAYIHYTLIPSKLKKIEFNLSLFCKLHKDMLGDVWSWAGDFRTTQTSIGVPAHRIHQSLYQLQDDLKFWQKEWDYQDTTTHLHHTLVKIHPFINGNGRWARLVTDLWLLKMGHEALSWGGNITQVSVSRRAYIRSLKEADEGVYDGLKTFMFEKKQT